MRKVRFPKREREISKNATDLDRNAAIRLYPYGASHGIRIATMHPSRIVLHIENTTDVYAYNTTENLMRAVIARQRNGGLAATLRTLKALRTRNRDLAAAARGSEQQS